jgi:hypothetical protein
MRILEKACECLAPELWDDYTGPEDLLELVYATIPETEAMSTEELHCIIDPEKPSCSEYLAVHCAVYDLWDMGLVSPTLDRMDMTLPVLWLKN